MALTKDQIAQYWINQGGPPKYAGMMANIALRESGGRPNINNRGLNKNGTVDWGLYQVNDIWRKDPVVGPLFKSGAILTPEGATKAAIHILQVQGPRAWATYNAQTDSKYLGGFRGGTTPTTPAAPTTPEPARTVPGVDRSALRRSLIADFVSQGGADNPNAVIRLATGLPAAQDTPARTVTQRTDTTPAAGGSTTGAFHITGPNPGRLTGPLVAFARKVAGVYGRPLTGSDGSGHSKFTVDGNVSDHWSGNATDIPATGRTLLTMGRAALIAAGMPRAQALRANGGLYNINGHQVIFLTNQGGNHFDHLHISV